MKELEIVVSTSPGREKWVSACLASIGRPCLVVSNPFFELGAINWIYQNTRINRFLYLQDSVQIKSADFWKLVGATSGSVAIGDDPGPFGSYLGIYERRILRKIGVPIPSGKTDAVYLEKVWCRDYELAAGSFTYLFKEFGKTARPEEYMNRANMVSENRYLKKYKGTWTLSQLEIPPPEIPRLSKRKRRRLKEIRAAAKVLDPNPE